MFKKTVSVLTLGLVIWLMGISLSFAAPSSIGDMAHESGKIGTYHALLFGIDSYPDKTFSQPKTASRAARQLSGVLENYYGFSTEMLLNEKATKEGMIQLLEALAVKVGVDDTVVIYFAGQGTIDKDTRNGYWYPYDATLENEETWLPNDTIQQMIRNIKANDILLISDSAYSDTHFGANHKLPSSLNGEYYLQLYNKQSRWGLTSGTDGPKGKGISVFTKSIINALKANTKPQLSLCEMYDKIKKTIRKASIRTPRCRSLKRTGDQGGEPIFVLSPSMRKKYAAGVTDGQSIDVKGSVVTPVNSSKPKKVVQSTISIKSNVPKARIALDGKSLGAVPVLKRAVLPGIHVVEIFAEGYKPYSKKVIVKRGKSLILDAKLTKEIKKPTKGLVDIKVVPSYARIRLTDLNILYTPSMMIEKGVHTVEISAPFYNTQTQEISVSIDKANSFSFNLDPMKKIVHKRLGSFVLIPEGEFVMGSPENEASMNSNEKQHTVKLTRPIYMQEKEMTLGQWRWFINDDRYKTESEAGKGSHVLEDYNWYNDTSYNWSNPNFKQDDDHPVVCVSWNDTQAFISWLNSKSSKDAIRFRLPSEAEWEYACRAGTSSRFSFGSCLKRDMANFDGNVKWGDCPAGDSSSGTVKVGSFKPNSFGLYDMHGNAMEWCQDWFGSYATNAVTDPKGPHSGTVKVVRGGGWMNFSYDSRSAKRMSKEPSASYSNLGFRLVLEPIKP